VADAAGHDAATAGAGPLADGPAGRVHLDVDDEGIAVITIDQPAKRNALTYPMLAELFAHVATAGADPSCHAVILTGAGGAFCSGTDLHHLQSIPPAERGYKGALTDDAGWWNLVACPKPVIAAVDGPAVGLGAELTSHCDVRLASSRARFSWNFVHRGLVPDTGAGTWLLPRQIGLQAALRLLYSGGWLEADDALRAGYVAKVVPPDQLLEAAREEARSYLSGAGSVLQEIKQLVYEGLQRPVAAHQLISREALLRAFRSAEHAEGVGAFTQRRPAGADRSAE
jgi:enoyl-CoA hydratase